MPVIDASATLYVLASEEGLPRLGDAELFAPALLWSEVTSVVSQMRWRGELTDAMGDAVFSRLLEARIARRANAELYDQALKLAQQLGWAKTYDAEYIALAVRLRTSLITRDERLRRGAGHIVEIVGPDEARAC